MANDNIHRVRLESIAPGGEALGRLKDGKPVFVEGGAPCETIVCRITEDRKTWSRAELLEITEPSSVRIESVCKFYGEYAPSGRARSEINYTGGHSAALVCGGCNLLHIDYNAQLQIKKEILKDSFVRIGGFVPPEPEIVFSPPLGYRNRMQFHCLRQRAKADGIKFGLKGRKSTEIISVNDCPVAEVGIRKILQSGGNDIVLPPEKDRFTVFSCGDLLLNEGGIERGKIKLLDKEILLDTGVFFQSNIVMLEKLILKLVEIAQRADRNLPMADLYCGVGTFAMFLCDMFPKTILAEENKKAITIARENLKNKDVEFFALRDSNWEQILLRKNNAHNNFGYAIIDPPRTGLDRKVAEALAQNGPPILAYVSCDAAALARDSAILTKGGYQLNELVLFDFYPQTAHIETLAVFEK